jgi:hypothetical protein
MEEKLKSSIFWDTMPCSPLKVHRSFRGKYRLHLQDQIISHARKESQVANKARANGGDMFLRNVGLTFNRLEGVISQKIELFITIVVRTSSPTGINLPVWNVYDGYDV